MSLEKKLRIQEKMKTNTKKKLYVIKNKGFCILLHNRAIHLHTKVCSHSKNTNKNRKENTQ